MQIVEMKRLADSIATQIAESTKQLEILQNLIETFESNNDNKWVTTIQAAELFNKNPRTIRGIAERNICRTKKRGTRNIELNLGDLCRYFKREDI